MDIQKPKEEIIQRWLMTQESLERAKSNVRGCECDLANALTALGKSLVPKDAKEGEKFTVWVSDKLLVVEYIRNGDYKAYWRK